MPAMLVLRHQLRRPAVQAAEVAANGLRRVLKMIDFVYDEIVYFGWMVLLMIKGQCI